MMLASIIMITLLARNHHNICTAFTCFSRHHRTIHLSSVPFKRFQKLHRGIYTNFDAHQRVPGYITTLAQVQTRNFSNRKETSIYSGSSNNDELELNMENIYMEWTLEDDRMLIELSKNNESIPKVAAQLGRGLRGVDSRLSKLRDVNSPAYLRLFDKEQVMSSTQKEKLTPAKEVMRRIQWDTRLSPSDFTVFYYDRVEDIVMSSAFDAKNDSVQGKDELFVFAIPEHRIVKFQYKERTVWDREKRLDCVFGSMRGDGETIDDVIKHYEEWKRKKDETDEFNRRRQAELVKHIKIILGESLFSALKEMSTQLQQINKAQGEKLAVEQRHIEAYVDNAISLFQRSICEDTSTHTSNEEKEGSTEIGRKMTSLEYLDLFSSLVALLPDEKLREMILNQIEIKIKLLSLHKQGRRGNKKSDVNLLELNEEDLSENFVRGSGAGGQKINKTANKVILVHEPTQVRVECQETRSLQQNRKIARKRLRLKVDEYLNGSNSAISKKASKLSNKKAKAKAKARKRNRARQQKKKEELEKVSD